MPNHNSLARQHRPPAAGWRARRRRSPGSAGAGGGLRSRSGSSAAMALVSSSSSQGRRQSRRAESPAGRTNAAALTLQQHGNRSRSKKPLTRMPCQVAARSGQPQCNNVGRPGIARAERTLHSTVDARKCPIVEGNPARRRAEGGLGKVWGRPKRLGFRFRNEAVTAHVGDQRLRAAGRCIACCRGFEKGRPSVRPTARPLPFEGVEQARLLAPSLLADGGAAGLEVTAICCSGDFPNRRRRRAATTSRIKVRAAEKAEIQTVQSSKHPVRAGPGPASTAFGVAGEDWRGRPPRFWAAEPSNSSTF